MIARNSSSISYHVNVIHFCRLYTRRRDPPLLALRRLQSPEHLHAGHAAPAHPLPHRPGVSEAAVRAARGPERAQPAAAAAAAQQSPLQPGPPAAEGPLQFSGGPWIQSRSASRPEPHVGVAFCFPRLLRGLSGG